MKTSVTVFPSPVATTEVSGVSATASQGSLALAVGSGVGVDGVVGTMDIGAMEVSISGVPSYIQNATAGEWTAIGTNTMDDVWFDYTANPPPGGFTTRKQGIINAWGGAAYDPVRHKYYVHGGGHNDYDGNEFYAFDMQTGSWSRLDDPSLYLEEDATDGINPDNGPIPVHTYSALAVDTSTGKVYRILQGGSTQSSDVCSFDPSIASQLGGTTTKSYWAYGSASPISSTSGAAVFDSDEGIFRVVSHNVGTFLQWGTYNPITDTWSSVSTGGVFASDKSAAYSPDDREFVCLGGGTLFVHNVDTKTTNPVSPTGDSISNEGGLVYDTNRNKYWYYSDLDTNRKRIVQIDPSTWVATEIIPSSGATPNAPVGGDYNGIFNRFRYCSDYDVFITVNDVTGSVYMFKPSDWSL